MASKHNLFKALLVKYFQCPDQGFVIFPRCAPLTVIGTDFTNLVGR